MQCFLSLNDKKRIEYYLEMNKFITINAEHCSALIVCKRKEK